MRVGRRVERVAGEQVAAVQHEEDDDGGDDRGEGRSPGQGEVLVRAQPERGEPVQRNEVGQVRHGQQERRGVGEPDGRQRERHRRDPELPGHGDDDGVSSTAVVSMLRTIVQRDREGDDEQPEQPGPVPSGVRGPVRCHVEDPGDLRHLGHDRHGDEEDHDRADAGGQVEELLAGHAASVARSTTCPAMGKAEVAAGDGALHTCTVRAVRRTRKSWTSVPSRRTACARMPAGSGSRSSTVSSGQ